MSARLAPREPFTVSEAFRGLLTNIESDLWRVYNRPSAFQAEHAIIKHLEYPGNADKFHGYGLALIVQYEAVSVLIHEVQVVQCDREAALARHARWSWARRLPAVARRLRRLEVEIAWADRRIGMMGHALSEYARHMSDLWRLRQHWGRLAEEAGESLDAEGFNRSERQRWIHLALENERVGDAFKRTVRTDFLGELATRPEISPLSPREELLKWLPHEVKVAP